MIYHSRRTLKHSANSKPTRAAILATVFAAGVLVNTAFVRAATMQELDTIVKEAGSVDGLLSNSAIQDRYYNALHEYYGEPFTRESFDRILGQLRVVAAKVPQLKERLWQEIPKSSLVISSEIPTNGRDLGEYFWNGYLQRLQSRLALEATPYLQLTAGDGTTSHSRISEAMQGIEARVQEFEQTVAGLKKKEIAAKRIEFYLALENEPEVKSIAAHIVSEHLKKPEIAAKLTMGDPDVILETLRDMQKNQMPFLPPAEFANGKKFPPGLANAVRRQLPNLDQLLDDENIFPVQMMKTTKGLIPVPAGPARAYEITTIPRRIHGIFKGIKLGECVGGSCSWLQGLSPERWATSALKGSRVFNVERGGSYLGFIQEVPIVSKRDGKIYSSLDIGVPQFANKVISVNRTTREYEPATLFERWLANAARKPPSTLEVDELRKWGGYVIGESAAIDNANALPTVKATAAYALFGNRVGGSNEFSHLDSLGDALPGVIPRVSHAADYGGRMIFDAFVPKAGQLTKLAAVDPQLVRDPVRFRQLADRANPEMLQRLIQYLSQDGLSKSEQDFRTKRLMLLHDHKDARVRFIVCTGVESMNLPGCGKTYKDLLFSSTASKVEKDLALRRISVVADKKFATETVRGFLKSGVVRDVAETAISVGMDLGLESTEILSLAQKDEATLTEAIKAIDRRFLGDGPERLLAWKYFEHESLSVRNAAQAALLDVPNSSLRLLAGANTSPEIAVKAFERLTKADFENEAARPLFKRIMDFDHGKDVKHADTIKGKAAYAYFRADGAVTDIPTPLLDQLVGGAYGYRSAEGRMLLSAMESTIDSRSPGYLNLVEVAAGLQTTPSGLAESAIAVSLENPDWAKDPARQKQISKLFHAIGLSDMAKIATETLNRDPGTPWKDTIFSYMKSSLNNRVAYLAREDSHIVAELLKAMIPTMTSGTAEERKAAVDVVDGIVRLTIKSNASFLGTSSQFKELLEARAASEVPLSWFNAADFFKYARDVDRDLVAKYVSNELVTMKHSEALIYATDLNQAVPAQRERIQFHLRLNPETPELKQLQDHVSKGYSFQELNRQAEELERQTMKSREDENRLKSLREDAERSRVRQELEVVKEAERRKKFRAALLSLAKSDDSSLKEVVEGVNRYKPNTNEFILGLDYAEDRADKKNLIELFKMLERGEYAKVFQKYGTGSFHSDYKLGRRLVYFRSSLSNEERVDFDKKIRRSLLNALKGGTFFKRDGRVTGSYWAIEHLSSLYSTKEEAHEIAELLVRRANATAFGRQNLSSMGYLRNVALESVEQMQKRVPIGRDLALQVISPSFALADESKTTVLRMKIAEDYIDDPKVARNFLSKLNSSDPQVRRAVLQILVSKRNKFPLELRPKLKESLVKFVKSGYAHELDKSAKDKEVKFGQLVADLGFDDGPEFAKFAKRGEFRSRIRAANPITICGKAFSRILNGPGTK